MDSSGWAPDDSIVNRCLRQDVAYVRPVGHDRELPAAAELVQAAIGSSMSAMVTGSDDGWTSSASPPPGFVGDFRTLFSASFGSLSYSAADLM